MLKHRLAKLTLIGPVLLLLSLYTTSEAAPITDALVFDESILIDHGTNVSEWIHLLHKPKDFPPYFLGAALHGTFNTPSGMQFLSGWSSNGVLDGGVYFFTDLWDNLPPTNTVSIWWDFTGSEFPGYPNGGYVGGPWALHYVTVAGRNETIGRTEERLYGVQWPNRVIAGPVQIEVPEGFNVNQIGFYGGTARVPESGSTLALVMLGLPWLFLLRRRARSRT